VIGPYLAMGPPLILAVIVAPNTVWWVFVLLFVLQFVVVNILMPRIMGRSLGLHPLLIFAAVLVGARVAGVWGAVFGVPVAAMLYLLGRAFYLRVVLRMPLYREGTPLSPEALVPAGAPAPVERATVARHEPGGVAEQRAIGDRVGTPATTPEGLGAAGADLDGAPVPPPGGAPVVGGPPRGAAAGPRPGARPEAGAGQASEATRPSA
jgi:hypothetical protein